MADRNREDRFRPRREQDDFSYNLHHGSHRGSEREYPLTDADRERFAHEDFTEEQ